MTTINLTKDECAFLAQLLETASSDKHAEVRRTEFSSALHDQLQGQERLLRGLLEKVKAADVACTT